MTIVSSDQSLLDAARSTAAGFDFDAVRIDPVRILRMHGYQDLAKVRPRVRDAAVKMADVAGRILQPAAALRCLPFHRAGTGVLVFADGVLFRCDAFERYLRNCDEAVVFVLSAGIVFDEQIAQFMDDSQPVNALFLNTAGWLCVEMLTRQLANTIKSAALDEDLQLTRRMGPGYSYRVNGISCSWELLQQRELFALLGAPRLAVSLLDSGGMQPQMSRSGLFGLRSVADQLL